MGWSEESIKNRREKFYKPKINKKFGRLTIIKYEGVGSNQKHMFKVKCDCGNIKIKRWNNLRDGGSTLSCGCYKAEKIKERMGVDIKQLCSSSIKNGCKSICKKRNFQFDLDIDFVKNMIFKNCFYCNGKPSNIYKSKNINIRTVKYNGLDRKDNKIGYIKSNVAPCCMECNYMKKDKNFNNFIEKCKKIAGNF